MSKIILGIGFIFSVLTIGLLMTIYGALGAIVSFIISIILRGIGWILLGKRANKGYFMLVGILVLVLGLAFLVGLFNTSRIGSFLNLSGVLVTILVFMLWVIYSIAEWFAYISIARRGNSIFYASLISIVGISLLVYFLLLQPFSLTEFPSLIFGITLFYYIILIPLLISSILTAIGFFTLDEYSLY